MNRYTIAFSDLPLADLSEVGGKKASIGGTIRNLSPLGIMIPDGFAITGEAFNEFSKFNKIYFLVQHGINSISFNPDEIMKGIENIAAAEAMRCVITQSTFPNSNTINSFL